MRISHLVIPYREAGRGLDPRIVSSRSFPSPQSVILVAFTAFSAPDEHAAARAVRSLRFEGELVEVALELSVRRRGDAAPFARHAQYINGLAEYETRVRRAVPVDESAAVRAVRRDGAHTVLEFGEFAPGGVLALRVAPRAEHAAAVAELSRALGAADPFVLRAPLAALDLADLNALLYRCDAEERAAGGPGVYEVPGWGALPYAGLQGLASLLGEVTPRDDLSHPLCDNLRAGDWLAEYVVARLEREPRLVAVAARCREALRPLAHLPRYLVPAYFAAVLEALYDAAVRAALARLLPPGESRGALWRALALTSVQLAGAVDSASLPPPSPALPPPRPLRDVTLSAGLPHFSVGYMRCWGRDTFIALRGLFLLTGRYQVSAGAGWGGRDANGG